MVSPRRGKVNSAVSALSGTTSRRQPATNGVLQSLLGAGSSEVRNTFIITTIVIVAAGGIIGGVFGDLHLTSSADTTLTTGKITADYREALEVVGDNYAGSADREAISDVSIQSMLWTLDPHSAFFTREEFKKLSEEQASQFYGIGVSILQHRDGVYVKSVVPGTPAEAAGLRYGDRITLVDGKDATEWTSAEVSKNVRGERGSTVKVRVERVSSPAPIDFEIVRGGVPLPSIRNYFMLPDGVGYIGLTGGFQETTASELNDAMAALNKQGMKTLVLDLRNNPGGILEQAVEVVSRFIPADLTVVSVKGRVNGSVTRELRSTGKANEKLPLIVLINGGSASASEIVAGAVQDYGRGLVLGAESFGKGLVQRVFRTPYGTGLTLTTARYYTPFGRSLQRDYSSGSIYDYYTNHDGEESGSGSDLKPKPAGVPVTLPDGRTLFGGRGIEPDLRVKAEDYGTARARINDAAFYFVRRLVAGKVEGFEQLKVEKQNHQMTVPAGSFVISDRLFELFVQFAVSDPKNGLSRENIAAESQFAKTRIRQELATANYSNEAGYQVLLEVDPVIKKAVESVPVASRLVEKNLAMR